MKGIKEIVELAREDVIDHDVSVVLDTQDVKELIEFYDKFRELEADLYEANCRITDLLEQQEEEIERRLEEQYEEE